MRTSLALLPIWLVVGCGSEQGFRKPPPSYPHSVPPEVADVTQVDRIVQVVTPQVDILWMIDNSSSMENEQTALGENFPLFMNFFLNSGLDYHIGVTSSDVDDNYNGSKGKLVYANGTRWVDVETPEPVPTFVAMASLGTGGSGNERGTDAIYAALELERDVANAGFWRDDAALHTIVISDEPDSSNGPIGEFVEWYADLKDETDQRTFSAIVDPNAGRQYVSVANQIGGIVYNVLDENWPQVLERLGVQAAGLKREYFLSQIPVDGTLVVQIEDSETGSTRDVDPSEYEYSGKRNSVTFYTLVPNSLSTIVLTYTIRSSQQSVSVGLED